MPFVAEDGTGLEDANSLCDLAFANEYFSDRGITAWTGSDAVKQQKLIQATDYVETRWSRRFKGCRQFPDTPQALSFPRTDIDYDDTVPPAIKKAVAEYALRAIAGALAPDPTVDVTGLQVQASRRKVGPIETETTYKEGGIVSLFKPYPMADALVAPFLRPSAGVVRG